MLCKDCVRNLNSQSLVIIFTFGISAYSVPGHMLLCFHFGSFLTATTDLVTDESGTAVYSPIVLTCTPLAVIAELGTRIPPPSCSYLCTLCMFQHLFKFLVLFIIWFSSWKTSCPGHEIWRQLSNGCTNTLRGKKKTKTLTVRFSFSTVTQ